MIPLTLSKNILFFMAFVISFKAVTAATAIANEQDRNAIAAFAALLRRSGDAGELSDAKQVHCRIADSGLDRDRFLGNLLIQMYGKCKSVEDARSVFDGMRQRNLFSWSMMIAAYAQNGHCKEALALFREMDCEGVRANSFIFVSLIGACCDLGLLAEGKAAHTRFMSSGFGSEAFVCSALVNMYAKCGSLADARRVFDNMPQRDLVCWNAMIGAYAQHGHPQECLELYRLMVSQRVVPNGITYIGSLGACSSPGDLETGKKIHSLISGSLFESDIVVQNCLIGMYGKCESLDCARDVFDRMQHKDAVSWSAMIAAYAQNGYGEEALQIYQEMLAHSVEPETSTYVSVLSACSMVENGVIGKTVHSCCRAKGLDSNVIVQNALVNMYAKCGSLEEASSLFDEISCKKSAVTSWTAMLTAYAQHGHRRKAMELFRKMDLEGLEQNGITLTSVLAACSTVAEGTQIHSRILDGGFKLDAFNGTALIDMYANCGCLDNGRSLFYTLESKNVVLWTAMIGACVQHGEHAEALQLYHQMQHTVSPNNVTFVVVLYACSRLGDLAGGKAIHAQVTGSLFDSDDVLSALLDMYSRCRSLDDARLVFTKMDSQSKVSWNAMIEAYCQHGYAEEALKLLQKMDLQGVPPDSCTFASILGAFSQLGALAEGKMIHTCMIESGFEPDDVVQTALATMYGKCGNLVAAKGAFDRMKQKDLVAWSAMVAAYAQHGYPGDALQVFQLMNLEGVGPNEATFSSILHACSHGGLVSSGVSYFLSLCGDHDITPTAAHYVGIVDILSRAGRLDEAEDLVHAMPFQPDALAWRTLLSGCKIQENVELGVCATKWISQLEPDHGAAYVLLTNTYAEASRGMQL